MRIKCPNIAVLWDLKPEWGTAGGNDGAHKLHVH